MWNPSSKPYLAHTSSVFATSDTTAKDTPASIIAYQKYGVKPSIIRHIARLSPTITYFKDCFTKYYLLYWSGKYLLQKLAEGEGTILKDDLTYIPCYSTAIVGRGYIQRNPDIQYKVSFRVPAIEFGIHPVAFISLATSENHTSNQA